MDKANYPDLWDNHGNKEALKRCDREGYLAAAKAIGYTPEKCECRNHAGRR